MEIKKFTTEIGFNPTENKFSEKKKENPSLKTQNDLTFIEKIINLVYFLTLS